LTDGGADSSPLDRALLPVIEDPTLEGVQAIVARIADRRPADVGPDTPLAEGGLELDSLRLLQTILACGETVQVAFDPDSGCDRSSRPEMASADRRSGCRRRAGGIPSCRTGPGRRAPRRRTRCRSPWIRNRT
jgi:acyl carrier protein